MNHMQGHHQVIWAAVVVVCAASAALADTLHVPAEYPTIQAAIDAAAGGAGNVTVVPDLSGSLAGFFSILIDLRDFDGGFNTAPVISTPRLTIRCEYPDTDLPPTEV